MRKGRNQRADRDPFPYPSTGPGQTKDEDRSPDDSVVNHRCKRLPRGSFPGTVGIDGSRQRVVKVVSSVRQRGSFTVRVPVERSGTACERDGLLTKGAGDEWDGGGRTRRSRKRRVKVLVKCRYPEDTGPKSTVEGSPVTRVCPPSRGCDPHHEGVSAVTRVCQNPY